MRIVDFYRLYIPALEKALDNDNTNLGFYVKGPTDYLNCDLNMIKEIEIYLDDIGGKNSFIDMVAYYFDAKSHNFPNIQGVSLNVYRMRIIKQIDSIKLKYNL